MIRPGDLARFSNTAQRVWMDHPRQQDMAVCGVKVARCGQQFVDETLLGTSLFLILGTLPTIEAIYAAYAGFSQADAEFGSPYNGERYLLCLNKAGLFAIKEGDLQVQI